MASLHTTLANCTVLCRTELRSVDEVGEKELAWIRESFHCQTWTLWKQGLPDKPTAAIHDCCSSSNLLPSIVLFQPPGNDATSQQNRKTHTETNKHIFETIDGAIPGNWFCYNITVHKVFANCNIPFILGISHWLPAVFIFIFKYSGWSFACFWELCHLPYLLYFQELQAMLAGHGPAQATSVSGALPCFTASGPQKLWSPLKARWLLAKEKFSLMSFPVTQCVANAYGCQPFNPCMWLENPHGAIGNSMHVGNVGTVLMAMLLSVELQLACWDLRFFSFTVPHVKCWKCFIQSHSVDTLPVHDPDSCAIYCSGILAAIWSRARPPSRRSLAGVEKQLVGFKDENVSLQEMFSTVLFQFSADIQCIRPTYCTSVL